MAFDATDIERLRAAVPINHRPSPEAAGRLTNDFLSVDLLRKSTPLQGNDLDRHNLGQGFVEDSVSDPDAVNPGFILTGSQVTARSARQAQVEERKRDDERRYVIGQIIAQIEARNRQITENLKRIEVLEEQETALDRHLARLQRGEQAELDDSGHLRDKEAEAAIREYEERYGIRVDRNDADQINLILQANRDEQMRLRRSNADLAADNDRDARIAIDMGANPASIPATVRGLRTTEAGKQSLDQATALVQSDALRQEIVDTRFGNSVDAQLAAAALGSVEDGFDEVASTESSPVSPLKVKPPIPS